MTVITCIEDAAAGESITVYVEDIDPGGCLCFPVITYPTDVVKIPRPVGTVGFMATTVPRTCP
mgnify:CR=1 FL=1